MAARVAAMRSCQPPAKHRDDPIVVPTTRRHPERYWEQMAVIGGMSERCPGGYPGWRWSALFVDLLAAFLEEAADRAGEPGNHGYRVDLHQYVEDSSSDSDRVLDLRGDRQQLSRRPEHRASERLDLGLLGMTLEQESRDRTEHVNPAGHDDDCHEMVPQPTMRGRRPTKNISKFAGSRPQHSKRHVSIVANTPDV